jgi:FMN reductase
MYRRLKDIGREFVRTIPVEDRQCEGSILMRRKPLILGIGGTLRAGSTTERTIEYCLAEATTQGAETAFVRGDGLAMPPYDPGQSERSAEARRLVELIRAADGIIIGSPGYHGSISGLIKNALDYTEDLRDDKRVYLDGRAVGCIACAAGSQTIGSTLATLRSIVHALRGWPTPLAVGVNTTQRPFNADGSCADTRVAEQLTTLARQVTHFATAFQSLSPDQVRACA